MDSSKMVRTDRVITVFYTLLCYYLCRFLFLVYSFEAFLMTEV
jgi:hypothetical protein